MAARPVPPTDLHQALEEALKELHFAEEAFRYADPEFVDFHIYRMQASEEKVALILRHARQASGIARTPALPGRLLRFPITGHPSLHEGTPTE